MKVADWRVMTVKEPGTGMSEEGSAPVYMGRSAGEMKRTLQTAPHVCPVCRYTSETLRQHIDTLFFERVNDLETRAAIRAAGGYCRRHAQLVERQADSLGTALICKDLLTNDLRAMEAGDYDRPPATSGRLSRLFDGSSRGKEVRPPCPLCQAEIGFEQLAIDSFLQALAAPDFAQLFERSSGLCLPHFRLAFDRCGDEQIWQIVLVKQKAVLGALIEELSELARKSDYRFRAEGLGSEATSWQRALHTTSSWPDE